MMIEIDEKTTTNIRNWVSAYLANFKSGNSEFQRNIKLKEDHTQRVGKEILNIEISSTGCQKGLKQKNLNQDIQNLPTAISDFAITVIYDNNPFKEGLETAWGFSCVVSKTEKTILFDTGGVGALLMRNMKKINVDPNTIDVVVLSHIHGDHTGGLKTFLAENPEVIVYLLKSFPADFKKDIEQYGAKAVEVHEPLKICENVYSTGEIDSLIEEQSLIIHTDKGLIVVTGCAHPGIVKIVNEVKNLINDDVLLVMGGFHLSSMGKVKLKKSLPVLKIWECSTCGLDIAPEILPEYYLKKNMKNVS